MVLKGYLQDIRATIRGFVRRPGFTAVAGLTMALGLGATTAIFSLVQGVLLEPLPYEDPEELVAVYQDYRARGYPEREVFGHPNFMDYRTRSETLEDMAVGTGWLPNLSGPDGAEQLQGARLSHSYLDVLGIEPIRGRGFRPEEDVPDAPRVVLVSHAFWRDRLGGDPDVLGTPLTLDGEPWTVVGVLPPKTDFPVGLPPDVIRPLRLSKTENRGQLFLSAIGRLAEGVLLEQARAELSTIAAALAEEYPEANEGVGAVVYPLRSEMSRQSRPALLMLLAAVALLLLIACANVGNLMLARTLGRRGELAVRSALGAGRGRLVRQLLTEGVLLTLAGGAAGLLVAWLGVDILKSLAPQGLAVPRLEDVALDSGTAGFAVLLALAAGALVGLAPAIQASRPDLARPLRDESRGATSRRTQSLRAAFVVVQTALALVLLVGSALLLQSFLALTRVDPGFDCDRLLTFTVALPRADYPERAQVGEFFDRLLERVEALPGVRAAAGVSNLPLSGRNTDTGFDIVGREPTGPAERPTTWYHQVTRDYFRTVGLELLEGRVFDEPDGPDAPLATVVNEAFERRYFPHEGALGHRIRTGDLEWEIIGKVEDTKNFGLADDEPPTAYLAQAQLPSRFLGFVVRTEGEPLALAPSVRRVLSELDPHIAAAGFSTMEDVLAGAAAPERAVGFLITLLGLVALALAAVGLYAVVAYAARQRTREIGIRMALGAASGDVLTLVLRHGLGLALLGLAVGLGCAALGSRWLQGLLFGIGPLDPGTYVTSALLLGGVALLATWLPARRAARLDPVEALRS